MCEIGLMKHCLLDAAASTWCEIWGSWIRVQKIPIFPGKFPRNFEFSSNFTKHFHFSRQIFEKFRFFQTIF